MNDLVKIAYEGKEVRTILKDGEIWWVAVDVCAILGIVNSSKALQMLDDDEKFLLKMDNEAGGDPNQKLGSPKGGGARFINIINESGLYTLIARSSKPEAKLFRKWVSSEVIPSIRKTGFYALPGVIPPQAMTPQITGGLNSGVVVSDHDLMDAKWLYSIGAINRKDLIRFRFGAAVEPSGDELDVDPLHVWWTRQVNALRQLKTMPDGDFPLTWKKLIRIIQGKPEETNFIKHCAYGTPHEKDKSYSRETSLFLAGRFFEKYEPRWEEQTFFNLPPAKAAYELFRSNYQYAEPAPDRGILLWPRNSHQRIGKLRELYEAGAGAYNAERIRAELFGNDPRRRPEGAAGTRPQTQETNEWQGIARYSKKHLAVFGQGV